MKKTYQSASNSIGHYSLWQIHGVGNSNDNERIKRLCGPFKEPVEHRLVPCPQHVQLSTRIWKWIASNTSTLLLTSSASNKIFSLGILLFFFLFPKYCSSSTAAREAEAFWPVSCYRCRSQPQFTHIQKQSFKTLPHSCSLFSHSVSAIVWPLLANQKCAKLFTTFPTRKLLNTYFLKCLYSFIKRSAPYLQLDSGHWLWLHRQWFVVEGPSVF